jgi:hypothetical protein
MAQAGARTHQPAGMNGFATRVAGRAGAPTPQQHPPAHHPPVYVPVLSATSEKSANRFLPVLPWCSLSSIRWAGITICLRIMSAHATMVPSGSRRKSSSTICGGRGGVAVGRGSYGIQEEQLLHSWHSGQGVRCACQHQAAGVKHQDSIRQHLVRHDGATFLQELPTTAQQVSGAAGTAARKRTSPEAPALPCLANSTMCTTADQPAAADSPGGGVWVWGCGCGGEGSAGRDLV